MTKRIFRCIYCKQKREDVKLRVDPYESEINGNYKKKRICGDCEKQAALEI